MTTPIFCTNCGTRLSPQVRFCESCGHPVASTSEPPPPALSSNEVVSHKSGRTTWVPFFLLFDFVVVLTVFWWLGWLNSALWSQWLTQTLLINNSSSVVTSPIPTVNSVDTNAVSLEDFVGFWMITEGEPGNEREAILAMSLEGGLIVAEIEEERVQLPILNGQKLEGSVVKDGVSIPVTVELNQDKEQITVTVLPPNSELQVAVGQRLEGIDDLDSTSNSIDSSPDSSGTVLSEQEALELLIALPEIADWMQRVQQEVPMNQAQFEIVETTPEQYLIRAYEMVNNPGEPSHTATLAWYTIDRQTGEVTPSIP